MTKAELSALKAAALVVKHAADALIRVLDSVQNTASKTPSMVVSTPSVHPGRRGGRNGGHGGGRDLSFSDLDLQNRLEVQGEREDSEKDDSDPVPSTDPNHGEKERVSTPASTHGHEHGRNGGRNAVDATVDADAALRVAMCGAWDGVGGASTSGSNRTKIHALVPRVKALAAERGVDAAEMFAGAVERFKADARARGKRAALAWLLENVDQWVDDPQDDPPPPPPLHLSGQKPPDLPPPLNRSQLRGGS